MVPLNMSFLSVSQGIEGRGSKTALLWEMVREYSFSQGDKGTFWSVSRPVHGKICGGTCSQKHLCRGARQNARAALTGKKDGSYLFL